MSELSPYQRETIKKFLLWFAEFADDKDWADVIIESGRDIAEDDQDAMMDLVLDLYEEEQSE